MSRSSYPIPADLLQAGEVPAEGPIARLQELLADRVAGGPDALDAADEAELAALQAQFPTEAASIEFDLLATTVQVREERIPWRAAAGVAAAAGATLPDTLRASLLRDADLVLGGLGASATASTSTATAAGTGAATATATSGTGIGLLGLTWRGLAMAGWISAAAGFVALLTLGAVVWRTPSTEATTPLLVDPQAGYGDPDSALSLSYHVVKERDAVRVPLEYTGRAQTSSRGLAIWSDHLQAGLLQLENVPANEPSEQQYQVWIVDADRPRGADHIEAGLFNIDPDQAVQTLAIKPALPVGRATGFVVTLEPAGGSPMSEFGDRVVLSGSR